MAIGVLLQVVVWKFLHYHLDRKLTRAIFLLVADLEVSPVDKSSFSEVPQSLVQCFQLSAYSENNNFKHTFTNEYHFNFQEKF